MNLLVVDDSEDARELTEAALRSAGYRDVQTAASAAEAFAALDIDKNRGNGAAPVDIVLLDVVMPEVDGIEACARIRRHARYQDMPIIMITSLDDKDSLSNAFTAGANDYIAKPVNRTELLARVRAALKIKFELEQRRQREKELLDFLAGWGERRSTLWIDEATGLLAGEVAEAYLTSGARLDSEDTVSVIALIIDRLGQVTRSQGEDAARAIRAKAAEAIRATTASIGAMAASYPNGLMIIVAPDVGAAGAQKLAHSLRGAVAGLGINNREVFAGDRVTASAAVVTACVKGGPDRVKLLTQAVTAAQRGAAEGGDRIVTLNS